MSAADLFIKKLAYSPLYKSFPDYAGGDDEVQAKQYMLSRFLSLDKKRDRRPLYSHFTCATDSTQIKVIMGAVSLCSSFMERPDCPSQLTASPDDFADDGHRLNGAFGRGGIVVVGSSSLGCVVPFLSFFLSFFFLL